MQIIFSSRSCKFRLTAVTNNLHLVRVTCASIRGKAYQSNCQTILINWEYIVSINPEVLVFKTVVETYFHRENGPQFTSEYLIYLQVHKVHYRCSESPGSHIHQKMWQLILNFDVNARVCIVRVTKKHKFKISQIECGHNFMPFLKIGTLHSEAKLVIIMCGILSFYMINNDSPDNFYSCVIS